MESRVNLEATFSERVNSSAMTIRLAAQDDEAAIQHVIRTVYDEYGFPWEPDGYHADLYDLKGYYLDPGDPFWVAEVDGKVVGTVALELFERMPGAPSTLHYPPQGLPRIGGCDCSIERLYVHPEGRRLGVGFALTQTVINEARRQGRTQMEIWSDKKFEDAHRLYKRFGAVVVAERTCDDPDESPEWGLIISL